MTSGEAKRLCLQKGIPITIENGIKLAIQREDATRYFNDLPGLTIDEKAKIASLIKNNW